MLTLTEAKAHLRVDIADDDVLITSLIAAATTATADYLDNPVMLLDATAPAPVKAAALLLIGDLYENRTSQVERPLHSNVTFERLLSPYRVMTA